ncbi:thioesterase superfamily protein [Methylobacterium sp. 4-46]|uniref:PaaI family thioesterase n=1 Tax=unclassified Methylobacterium TaxID=2615210 RepID=UPI000152CE69|nr:MULTISPECIES: PaaI family thioesterase [Methylobacterium]ACA15167.1 thioesterase superfamily protein [Methylobacterium sp. 4-46]WFT80901.1 PaaI family thioesterase [Methylobacterium nodulans]
MTSDTPEPSPARRRLVEWADPRLTARAGLGRAGLDFLRALMSEEVPRPPISALVGMEMVSAESGQVIMRMAPGEHLYNPIGCVHGGAIATLLDSAMGCAVHSLLPEGRGYTTLEMKVNYLRALTRETGVVTAVGEVLHAGRQQAVAEARLTDEEGRLCATATSTCLLFDLPARPSA